MDTPYIPLSLARREIRILELTPGNYADDLVIVLHIESLHQKLPEYYALSYAWGKLPSLQKASVDGRAMAIGLNLDCALRHIRCTLTQPIRMWVDALCIDQYNIDERNSQVLLMKEIYSSAERVLIYLGPEHADSAAATTYIRRNEIPQSKEAYFSLLDCVESICQRPWFGRVWVAQELALSRQDPTVYLGTTTIPWSQLYDYFVNLDQPPGDLDGHSRITSFMEIMYRVRRLGRVRVVRTASLNLQIFRSAPALATDERDKVFGLLGICAFTPNQIKLVPDYTKSTSRVFAEATVSMLQEGGNLPYGLLPLQPPSHLREGCLYQRLPDLPTWALDLNISSQAAQLHGQNGPYWLIPNRAVHPGLLLSSTDHIPNRVQVCKDFKRLTTFGIHLGTVVATYSSVVNDDGYRGFQKRATALRSIYNVYMKPRQISAYSLLQALTVDFKSPVLDSNISENFPALFEQLLSSQADITFPSPFFDILVAMSNHETCLLFFTDNNHVGITNHHDLDNGVREGDEVVGLLGINFPFVLRSLPGGLEISSTYNMINIAHVADHQWEHDFLKDARPGAQWSDFQANGLKEYTIV